MHPGDLSAAAALHLDALPHGFFSRLGSRFLGHYLGSFLDSPHAVAIVATESDRLVGFLVGVLSDAHHYSAVVRRHGASLALHAGVALLRRPGVGVAFIRTRAHRYARGLWRVLRRRSTAQSSGTVTLATLEHVAVAPCARGSGVGRDLVRHFTARAAEAGCDGAQLVTRADEGGASAFYRHLGWRAEQRLIDHEGAVWQRFVLRWRMQSASAA